MQRAKLGFLAAEQRSAALSLGDSLPDNRGNPWTFSIPTSLKDRYDFELERKDKITAAVNFPVTMLILVAGLMGALYPKLQLTHVRVVLIAAGFYVGAVVSGVVALLWFIRAYRGSTYEFLPLLRDIADSIGEWRAFYEAAHADGAEKDYFENEFMQRIIQAADRNTQANDRRQAYLDRGVVALIWMFSCTALSAAVSFFSVMFTAR